MNIFFEDGHHVSLNYFGNFMVSTVKLPRVNPTQLVQYETCVFEGDDGGNVIGHYYTEKEAIDGHNRILKDVMGRYKSI
jgi:hypothetical protein